MPLGFLLPSSAIPSALAPRDPLKKLDWTVVLRLSYLVNLNEIILGSCRAEQS